jgi:peptidoglycan/LPS O-acetylase OafA/YrhL
VTFAFLAGASAMASLAIALFFLRFWREHGDRLFLIFAIAFVLFAINRVLLSALGDESDARTIVYLARAVAFGLIAAAIIDKNWPRPTRPARPRSADRDAGGRSRRGDLG